MRNFLLTVFALIAGSLFAASQDVTYGDARAWAPVQRLGWAEWDGRWRVHVNAASFSWPNYRFSLYALLLHEVGHVLGYGHAAYVPASVDDIMVPVLEF